MFQDAVHSILKDYRETKSFFWEKPSKLKNLILLFSVAINDRINALMLSALVRSFIQGVNITEWQMSCSLNSANFLSILDQFFFLIQSNPNVPGTSLISLFISHAKE